MDPIRCFQVDAFTDRPFAGNPAAVCLLDQQADAAWMQAFAAELNLSETAFVRRQHDGFSLRWFTPKVEVDLCGHATLASAHILWTEGVVADAEAIRFHTKSGVLTCRQAWSRIELDFPASVSQTVEPPAGLLDALGLKSAFVARSRFDYLVLVDQAAVLRSLAPDFRKLIELKTRGIIVTARSDDARYDFVSRFFAPAAGIDEDPVTGSAHCCLGPFWAERLGKTDLTGFQASPRGGIVYVRVARDRVILAGQAVTIWRGELA
ncbi:MAG TPA: PhzF family phenazine biosynthesis protein [Pirellulales bacterium]|jgi:PhzF family phenazine biosynthesis protein|nr:PhzF family phenazine biosynthesis protein [Pirellulales bacterium]